MSAEQTFLIMIYRALNVVENFNTSRSTCSVMLGNIFSLDLNQQLLPFRVGVRKNPQGEVSGCGSL